MGQDFMSSLLHNKIFRQANEIEKNYKHSYLFIITEDIKSDIDKVNFALRYKMYEKAYFTIQNYYGAYASLCQITIPVVVKDYKEAWVMMDYIFSKTDDNKRRDISPPEFKVDNPVITYLASIRGVNLSKASLVSRALALENLEDLLSVDYYQLTRIKGIGDVTAKKIIKAIKEV